MAERSPQAQVAVTQESEQAKKAGKTVERLETRVTYTFFARLLLGARSDAAAGD